MHDETKKSIDRDLNRIMPYVNEDEDLQQMCKYCERYCGKEHNYENCLNMKCFTFYRCYSLLDAIKG